MTAVNVTAIKLKTLSPLNYYYIAAAGGMRTSNFLGDIALKYGVLHQMGYLDYPPPQKFQPDYKELNSFSFWFTVAVNEKTAFGNGKSTLFMKNMIRNTMQGIDYNGTNRFPNAGEGSTMYKNFYFQQPIKPGNEFYCFFISKKEFDLPKAVRMGNGKTGILEITKTNKEFRGVLNYFTISNVMKMQLPNHELTFTEHNVLQYYLTGMFSKDNIMEIYNEWSY